MKYAHFIRVRYHGPSNTRGSRFSATWEGWPSDDGATVRRYLKTEPGNSNSRELAAQEAAELFVAWLSAGAGDKRRVAEVITAEMPGRDWAVLVRNAIVGS